VAGVAATVGSYPFDLLRTVMASQGEPKVCHLLPHHFFGREIPLRADSRLSTTEGQGTLHHATFMHSYCSF